MAPFDHPKRGERPTVVLLHSSGNSARQWASLAARLAARYEVVAPDFHGHGKRGPWTGRAPLTLADAAALVTPLLDVERPVHLIGHSFGGAVALKAAAQHPGAVASVLTFEPVLFRWLLDDAPQSAAVADLLEVVGRLRTDLERGDAYRAAARFLTYWAGPGAWEAMAVGPRDVLAGRMRHVLGHFGALFDDPLSPGELRRIRAPMLFLSGERTVASTRCIAALLAENVPDARHEVLPRMDHLGPVNAAAAFERRVLAFLDEADGAPSARARSTVPWMGSPHPVGV